MRELLQACADAWGQAGASELHDLIGAIETAQQCKGAGVPEHLQGDFHSALENMTVFPDLKQQLMHKGEQLHWSEGSMKMPDSFRGRFAYVELAGPKGMLHHSDISFGFYLQQSDTVYPNHWHEAVEHYLILSGTADWQMDAARIEPRRPGSLFVHASNQRHATTTRLEPLLAMWFWQGNISDATYRIDGVKGLNA